MNRNVWLNHSFGNINGRIYRLWGDDPEIATIHTKPSNITSSSNSVRGFRLSSIAVALLAALSAPAIAENITYGDNSLTPLEDDPLVADQKSFYPTTDLFDNTVTVNTVSGSTSIPYRVYGGVSKVADLVTGNNVFINTGAQVTNRIYGGYSETGSATNNTVTLTGGMVGDSIRGGNSRGTGVTANNAVIMTDGTVGGDIYGGVNNAPLDVATGIVTDNTVSISGGTVSGAIYTGYNVKGSATNNLLEISNSTVTGRVHGGYIFDSSLGGVAENNTVTVSGGANLSNDVYGALIADESNSGTGIGSASSNTVTINGGTVKLFVYGAYNFGGTGAVSGNTVTMNSGTVGSIDSEGTRLGNVLGGRSSSGGATANTVNINGGEVFVDVIGGKSILGVASNNTVNISGGTVGRNIYGGYADANSATGNTVNISGAPTFTNSILYGGFKESGTGDVMTGNMLVYGGGYTGTAVAVQDIQNFQNYQFNLSGVQAGDTIFSVNAAGAGPDMAGSTVSITAPSVTAALGSKVTLISKTLGTYAGPTELAPVTGTNGANYTYVVSQSTGNPLSLFSSKLTTTGDLSLTGPYAANAGTVAGESVTLDVGGTLTMDGALSMTSNATNAATLKAGTLVTPALTLTGPSTSATIGTLQVSQDTSVNLDATSTSNNVAINGLAFSNSSAFTVTPNGGSMTFGGNLNVMGSGNTLNTPIAYNAAGKALGFDLTGVSAGDTMLSVNDVSLGPVVTGSTVNIIAPPTTMALGERVTLISKTQGTYGPTELAPVTGTDGADHTYVISQSDGNPLSLFSSKLTTLGDLSLTGPYAANAGTVAGESVTLDVGGTLTMSDALSMTSNATNAATLNAGTLVTPALTLSGANTSANIGTLQVSQNTAVNLDATSAGNVAINDLAFANRSVLTVTPTNGGRMTFGGNLSVMGSGNTLNTPIAYNAAGKALNFNMAGVAAGDTMLSVNGSQPNLTGATLNITDVTNPSFHEGDRVTFIHADGGITGDAILPSAISRSIGLISYELGVAQTQNDLYAQIVSLGASEASKALLEGQVANLAFVNQGADLVAGAGLRAANNATQQAEGAIGYSPFVAMSGGSLRYTTGSSVEVSGVNMVMGLAARSTRQSIDYLGGAFFEFGQGNYSTFNSFVNSPEVHGDGDTDYMGGGILGRAETPYSSGRLYGEASLRAGSVDNQFNTSDIMPNAESSTYDISSPYVGAHGGVGYEFAIASGFTMDVSDRLIWTQQDGESATVNDQHVKFDAANSLRNRVGARLSAEITEKFKPYIGTYWEHEFDGEQNGSVNDHAIDAPTLEGDTGIAELGFTLLSSKDHLNIDAGVQGYTGKREDLTGSLRARWDF